MTGTERGELLLALDELGEACPDYRFGQMIAFLALGPADGADRNFDDADLLTTARKHIEDWKRQRASSV